MLLFKLNMNCKDNHKFKSMKIKSLKFGLTNDKILLE